MDAVGERRRLGILTSIVAILNVVGTMAFFRRGDMVRKWDFLENFLLSENKAIVQCTNLRGDESDSGIGIIMKSFF